MPSPAERKQGVKSEDKSRGGELRTESQQDDLTPGISWENWIGLYPPLSAAVR